MTRSGDLSWIRPRTLRVFVYGTLCGPDTAGTVLDEFEHVGPATLEGRRRVEGSIPWTRVGDPAALDAPATWPGDGPFRDCVTASVADNGVVIRPST